MFTSIEWQTWHLIEMIQYESTSLLIEIRFNSIKLDPFDSQVEIENIPFCMALFHYEFLSIKQNKEIPVSFHFNFVCCLANGKEFKPA